jgi:hypothetical protein
MLRRQSLLFISLALLVKETKNLTRKNFQGLHHALTIGCRRFE